VTCDSTGSLSGKGCARHDRPGLHMLEGPCVPRSSITAVFVGPAPVHVGGYAKWEDEKYCGCTLILFVKAVLMLVGTKPHNISEAHRPKLSSNLCSCVCVCVCLCVWGSRMRVVCDSRMWCVTVVCVKEREKS